MAVLGGAIAAIAGSSSALRTAGSTPPAALATVPAAAAVTSAATGPQERAVQAGNVRISYIDYGGSGPAVVLLPGLNDTGHIFDGLAPTLTDRYHVYSPTRRGCGDSDKPDGGYDVATRVADLRNFLDALKLDHVTLIGHSLSGDDLTGFAATYPGRVDKLVYLDAAYDRGSPGSPFAIFASLSPAQAAAIASTPPAALASLDAYRAFAKQFARGAWSDASESNMRAKITLKPDGTVVEKCPARIAAALIVGSASAHLDESKVTAPALCFFALPPEFTAEQRQAMGMTEAQASAITAWFQSQIGEARDTMHAQVVVFPAGTSHYLFIQHPNEVATRIRSFLDTGK
jgi:pimeloyl-ACP methyl ester carboxylesterase